MPLQDKIRKSSRYNTLTRGVDDVVSIDRIASLPEKRWVRFVYENEEQRGYRTPWNLI